MARTMRMARQRKKQITTNCKSSRRSPWWICLLACITFNVGCIGRCHATEQDPSTSHDQEANGRSTEWTGEQRPGSYELVETPWGAHQEVFESHWNKTQQILRRMEEYMTGEFLGHEEASLCKNYHSKCSLWAAGGECERNRRWMYVECAPSCLACHNVLAEPEDIRDEENMYFGEIKTRTLQMVEISWGDTQQIFQGIKQEETWESLETTYLYMTEMVQVKDEYASARSRCTCHHRLCSFWAALGECELNPGYMNQVCAPSCQRCEIFIDELNEKQGLQDAHEIDNGDSSCGADDGSCAFDQHLDEGPRKIDIAWGESQIVVDSHEREIRATITRMNEYMDKTVSVENKDFCKCLHERCSSWATFGECENNPEFMWLYCAPSCQTCHKLVADSQNSYDETLSASDHPTDDHLTFEDSSSYDESTAAANMNSSYEHLVIDDQSTLDDATAPTKRIRPRDETLTLDAQSSDAADVPSRRDDHLAFKAHIPFDKDALATNENSIVDANDSHNKIATSTIGSSEGYLTTLTQRNHDKTSSISRSRGDDQLAFDVQSPASKTETENRVGNDDGCNFDIGCIYDRLIADPNIIEQYAPSIISLMGCCLVLSISFVLLG